MYNDTKINSMESEPKSDKKSKRNRRRKPEVDAEADTKPKRTRRGKPEHKDENTLGGRVHKMRLERNMTLAQLAEEVNKVSQTYHLMRTVIDKETHKPRTIPPLTQAQISRLEMKDTEEITSAHEVRTNGLLALSLALDCSCDYLVGRPNTGLPEGLDLVTTRSDIAELIDIYTNGLNVRDAVLLLELAHLLRTRTKYEKVIEKAQKEVNQEEA